MKKKSSPADYSANYSESGLWRKLRGYALVAGRELVDKVLVLYYTATDPATPKEVKAIALSALGYFIVPLDVIPDIVPIAGFSDDLGAVVLAIGMIARHIKPIHRQKAREKLAGWFGPRVQ